MLFVFVVQECHCSILNFNGLACASEGKKNPIFLLMVETQVNKNAHVKEAITTTMNPIFPALTKHCL